MLATHVSNIASCSTACNSTLNTLSSIVNQTASLPLAMRFYGKLSLSEKTRVSLFANAITKAWLSLQLFKDPECWSGCGFESATSRTVALCSINWTGQWLVQFVAWLVVSTYLRAILRLTEKRTVALNGINLKQLSINLLRCVGVLRFNI